MSLPQISIKGHECDWHGCPVFQSGGRWILLSSVAEALGMTEKELAKTIGPKLSARRAKPAKEKA